jgi:hypothetical protein
MTKLPGDNLERLVQELKQIHLHRHCSLPLPWNVSDLAFGCHHLLIYSSIDYYFYETDHFVIADIYAGATLDVVVDW